MNPISFQSVYQTSTNRGTFKLGERAMTPDGRKWTFVKNGSTLVNGNIVVPSAAIAVDNFSSSTDNQSRIVYLTSTNAAYTIGGNEDAIGVVDDGTGAGQTFKVRTNSATTLTLYPETALTTALSSTDSDVTIRNMSQVVIAAITSKIQQTQGAAQVAAVSGDYLWILTEGDGRVMAGEVLIIGSNFVSGDDTTGQVVKGTTAKGPFDEQNLGYSIVANAAADQGALVRFQIR